LTIHRPLSAPFPELPASACVAIAAAAVLPVVGFCYLRTGTITDRLVAFLATVAAGGW
jgi:hypothetical protein